MASPKRRRCASPPSGSGADDCFSHDEEMVSADADLVPRLAEIASHRLISKHFKNSPILNAILVNARTIDAMPTKKWGSADDNETRETDSILLEATGRNLQNLHTIVDGWLNVGNYANIPDYHRLIYAYVSALIAVFAFKRGDYLESIKAADLGLLKGNDLEDDSLSQFASFLCRDCLPAPQALPTCPPKGNEVPPPPSLPNSIPIPVLTLPALSNFFANFYAENRPLVIRGIVAEWPAFQKWSFDYLNEVCGHRTVPVELGSKYTDDDWRQTLMTFHEYLRDFVFPESPPEKTGYMAQHRLVDQVPELLADLHPIPDYCEFGTAEDEAQEEDKLVNMFIGPAGTVSPLHTDPRHNFFCQIRGRKFVRLISPDQKANLYLHDHLIIKNTSQVDVENPDLDAFPDFATVPCEDFLMEPGDCLFIPRGYFHHVRGLERSISVSIWFGASGKIV